MKYIKIAAPVGAGTGLTLTWDVLKSSWQLGLFNSRIRLTLTWDVLKYRQGAVKHKYRKRLTLTWDVLKYI